jgi:hypothetical protein
MARTVSFSKEMERRCIRTPYQNPAQPASAFGENESEKKPGTRRPRYQLNSGGSYAGFATKP